MLQYSIAWRSMGRPSLCQKGRYFPTMKVNIRTLVSQQNRLLSDQSQLLQTFTSKRTNVRRLQFVKENRGTSTLGSLNPKYEPPAIVSVLPGSHLTAKVIFKDVQSTDFKYIWLRDNCKCPQCQDPPTKQKLVDITSLDINIKPKSVSITKDGQLKIVWNSVDEHESYYRPEWLAKYGRTFLHNTFESDTADKETLPVRSELELWDLAKICQNLPELSYSEFMESDNGVFVWLDMFYRYGVALLRGVPVKCDHIKTIVNRYAYVKETQYGQVFDVKNQPQKGSHLAFSGIALAYHTDMNYREKSPGMQLLHCLKANDPKDFGDVGGRSMFVDGYRVAKWMEEHEPTAFHVLASTPVRFSIKNSGMRYSAIWPVICTNTEGDITEIHYNNRTMQPLQAPTHIITPFYHAYQLFSRKLNEPAVGMEFNMIPGDLVAFNNRRVLHARSAYDVKKVNRHLQGCYVDIDEAFSKYDQLLLAKQNAN